MPLKSRNVDGKTLDFLPWVLFLFPVFFTYTSIADQLAFFPLFLGMATTTRCLSDYSVTRFNTGLLIILYCFAGKVLVKHSHFLHSLVLHFSTSSRFSEGTVHVGV